MMKTKPIKEKLRLSTRNENISQDIMFETIADYIQSDSNISRQLEKAHNIIKFLKLTISNLQQQTIA